ncbi:hypothetical protein [Pedobacter gandavensis]|uniref:Uncharacterized protein n=1 Tax=Pedobacter gandavensis TaxID=2679963 RepID=A0ABR6ETY8_9SPHI|nr:hypothetical protein [Pedobacter gandavensis]MBB2148657.1 hypothetical protein [Pedobacter gandavensis]
MNNITPYPVLECVVSIIEDVISGIKVDYTSESKATLIDGNAGILLEQQSDSNGNLTINIKDPKDIILSEDLLPDLQELHKSAKGALKTELEKTTIIINGLDVETQLVYQSAKDAFDQISNSYEFVKTLEKEVSKIKSTLKFGSNVFDLTVSNEQGQILISPEFASSFNAAIQKTVEDDALKVQNVLNIMFKENK